MFVASVKATKSSFQKGMLLCLSIYMKKVMKLLAFIFEQSSYSYINILSTSRCVTGYLFYIMAKAIVSTKLLRICGKILLTHKFISHVCVKFPVCTCVTA